MRRNVSPALSRLPEAVLHIAFGFTAAKALFSAVELGLFDELDNGAATADEIRERLALRPRAVREFLHTFVHLRLLERADGLF